MTYFRFEILHQSKRSKARVGRIHTPHGIIETPNFVPVATQACMKYIDTRVMDELDAQLVFCNTYHLMLHPGPETVKAAGGLHSFMQRKKPLITDSGGFQVFSLAYGSVKDELKSRGTKKTQSGVTKIDEKGVLFRSYRDGAAILLTPETSVQAQKALGADIIIPFDELPPYHITPQKLKRSFDRTHRWELRSLQEHLKNPQNQAMYGVVHGGVDPGLRAESARILSKNPFDGYAIGGSLGKNHPEMFTMLEALVPHLVNERPRHLLGIGDLTSLVPVVELGMDTMDSSYPTKCARHGVLFCDEGVVKIDQTRWKNVFEPISPAPGVSHYPAAYLHHLFKAHEPLGLMLASIHNIHYMVNRMKRLREMILNDEV